MKVCVISGRHPKTKFESSINHKIYAEKHQYSYIHCDFPTKAKNPYFNKIYYILSYLDLFEYIIWIDDDAFFLNFDKDIMDYLPTGNNFISFCKSPDFKKLKTYLSSGQFILKSNKLSKSFLNDVLKVNLKDVKKWWYDDLGYFSNGDQDAIIFLLKTNTDYNNKYMLFNYKEFNSRPENLFGIDTHKPLILHFTGKPNIKKKKYLKVQTEYKLSPSLVQEKYLKDYKIIPNKKNRKKKLVSKLYKWLSS
ncbi:hypothetical protein RM697_01685 [Ichthyenterobacterium sp. W332]|uniref:Nucleotide-diphospho-sugar transferase domain-containing protein n=1 Tax=Microcosmobacter mediterraneus TaxID=3075607 RepID=A0ABU2YI15_9FLAO|nr:putative nucleotide-diphospho-sugar transferase [Ichthyenterobacterium sp. W332]MDT0557339.1 hypothetical protein [Ichthyenterobacterium sp. W332]